VADIYRPHALLTNPPAPSEITLELLLASQAHLGHSTSLWHPANSQYIFGIRQGIHIISLEQTAAFLRRACKVVEGVTYRGGLVLFVGNRPGQARIVINAAKRAGGCHLFQWWIPGTVTNKQQILGNCRTKIVDEYDTPISTNGEQTRETPALKPDLVVCLNPQENFVMLRECGEHGIPTIGVVDTDTNPTWVTYPIPANDDSLRCMQVIGGALGKAGEEGKTKRINAAKQDTVTYSSNVTLDGPAALNAI
jgi:small subunit ribosomal protein S2